jgi:threonine aldolase
MLSFESDYITGAHPKVLQALIDTNYEPLSGYGNDKYSTRAKEKIKAACQCPDAEVFFLAGGTQTNRVVIGSVLRDYEGVVAANTGHVALHEAGAIEATGHKVLTRPHKDGYLDADTLQAYLEAFYVDDI